jgi:hypothetical protein
LSAKINAVLYFKENCSMADQSAISLISSLMDGGVYQKCKDLIKANLGRVDLNQLDIAYLNLKGASLG